MKTKLQTALASICPSVCIETIWEHDDCPDWGIFRKGSALHGEDEDDWQAWQSEIRASTIVGGDMITHSAYVGDIWEKYGDDPNQSNPQISGYERQMTMESLRGLGEQVTDVALAGQIIAAIKHCEAVND